MPNDNVLTDEQIESMAVAHGLYGVRKAVILCVRDLLAAHPGQPEPIDMLLFCPKCGKQHIDEPEVVFGDADDSDGEVIWDNPPHRSHLCHACGTIWRPADVPTNGVAAIATRGRADTWDGKPEPRAEVMPLKVERHSDMSVLVVFNSCRQASVFEREIAVRIQGVES
ncbi:Uncharacterised protein [Burkholderia pseudomallei]|nr:Uncharacterised protein [Burkholderia pseudomallei]